MSAAHKILVVYYSRSGTTQRIAELLASELGADIEAIREPGEHAARRGARGYVRSLLDALRHRDVRVMPPIHDLSAYDAVVVGTPVWASHASAPAVAWLKAQHAHIRHLALFCTLGGRGSQPALDQMAKAVGKTPLAVCAVTAHDLRRRIDGTKRQGFGQKIRHRLAKLRQTEWIE
ncbi:flavodoxin [Paraburkholderia phymatum]|uniref:Putative flavodoxin n=1 Tax=Paraburkholderia phymatum (strain DSM 17167 / CIP 108236 / LMG 21445 / STM815) TaxID=391038 RepID=B2JVA6_PARP8|nr:flavodoxin [Paraburkholderia phymatum]ACC74883.1 putative flavodoxin [Paraburkholderia phymatum STM815]